MKVEFTFLHVDSSDTLKSHTIEKLHKIDNFEYKPMDIHIVISQLRHECIAEINVLEGRRKFQAKATSNDYYKSVDKAVEKLRKQLSRGKRRMKHHKHHDHIHNLSEMHDGTEQEVGSEIDEGLSEFTYKKAS